MINHTEDRHIHVNDFNNVRKGTPPALTKINNAINLTVWDCRGQKCMLN